MQEYTFYVVVNNNGDYLSRQYLYEDLVYAFINNELSPIDLYDDAEKATCLAGEYGGKVKKVRIIVEED